MLVSIPARAIGMDSSTISPTNALRKTPLNALHRRLGAKMVNFGGWDMPVEYPSSGGIGSEHKAECAMMGVVYVSHGGDIPIHSGKKHGGGLSPEEGVSVKHAFKLVL